MLYCNDTKRGQATATKLAVDKTHWLTRLSENWTNRKVN